MIAETQQRIRLRCSLILATVAALPQEQVLRLVPQEQVLRLVDEAKTNRFQFQKTSVTDNTKPQGDLDSVSVEFCQPRTRFGFRTLHQRHVAIKLNNYRSFHRETGAGVGALLTDINTDFLAKIGGESSLLDTFDSDQQEASFPRVMKSEVMASLCQISPTFALSTKIGGAPCF